MMILLLVQDLTLDRRQVNGNLARHGSMTHVPLMLLVHPYGITRLTKHVLIILLLHLPEHLRLVKVLYSFYGYSLGVFIFDVRWDQMPRLMRFLFDKLLLFIIVINVCSIMWMKSRLV